jgi:amino acid permease
VDSLLSQTVLCLRLSYGPLYAILIFKGFVCGWVYWLSYIIGPAAQLVATQNIMAFWVDPDKIHAWVGITAFILIPALFNFLKVRRFGELEFGLTAIKLITIVGLIVLGVVLPWGASAGNRKLGYMPYNSSNGDFVPSNELLSCPDLLSPTPRDSMSSVPRICVYNFLYLRLI